MNFERFQKSRLRHVGATLATIFLTAALAVAGQQERSVFVLTSTNNANGNAVVVFKLDAEEKPALTLVGTLPTGAKGGASTNAGVLQFKGDFGAVANYGSNSVSQLVRNGNFIALGRTITLARDCVKPDSVALTKEHLFVVGANCAESHGWPSGDVDGTVVRLSDPSAAQIAVGENWAGVTLSSGSVLQLPLTQEDGALNGTSATVTLPSNANSVPLGAAFWGNILGFTPAHSPDSFAIVNENRTFFRSPDRRHLSRPTLPAGWPRDRGAFGTRAILPDKQSPFSSAMPKVECSTNPCQCQAYLPT